MTHLLGTRGKKGGLVVRRGSDWATRPDGIDTMRMAVRVEDVDDATGTFEGWGCIFGVEDSYGTTFQPGCFTQGGLDEAAYPLLAMHNPNVPLGTFTAEEREEGLWIAGQYDPTVDGQAWRARALSGSAPELSVGFIWRNSDPDDEDLITDARLVETSQITLRMAAVPGAMLSAVRTMEEGDTYPDPDPEAVRRAHALLALRLVEA